MSDRMDVEGHRSGWLLNELDILAADKLPDEAQNRLRRKVESKLESAIHARIKGGMSYEDAELDAVATFGSPDSFLMRYLDARQHYYETVNRRPATKSDEVIKGPTDEGWIALFWCIGLAVAAWLFFEEGVEIIPLVQFVVGLLLLPIAIVKSRAKKELSGMYVALGGLACLLVVLGILVASSNRFG